MTLISRLWLPVFALSASALILPALAVGTAARAAPAPQTASVPAAPAAAEPTTRKAKAPKGMSVTRLQKGIERTERALYYRDCTPAYDCSVTYKWGKLTWRGTARLCVEGYSGTPCAKYAKAFVARVDLLVTKTRSNYAGSGKKFIEMYQSGYWQGGTKTISYTDDFGAKQSECKYSLGCGKDLYIWQDALKDWYYSFTDGTCCSGVRLI